MAYKISYTYDAAGNRATKTETRDGTTTVTTYTYDAANQLVNEVSPAGTITYTYDGAGNCYLKETPEGDTHTTYDAANQATRVEPPSGAVDFTYNAFYQRVRKDATANTSGGDITKFIYDHKRLLAETDDSDVTTKSYTSCTKNPAFSATGEYGDLIGEYDNDELTNAYPDYDAQWNTKELLDDTGDPTASYRNTAFGLQSPEAQPDWCGMSNDQWDDLSEPGWDNLPACTPKGPNGYGGQAGYYHDKELELYLMGGGGRGRYYDPATGRFTSQDPSNLAGGDTNLYRYVNNNPVNGVDPSGNEGEFVRYSDATPEQLNDWQFVLGQLAEAERLSDWHWNQALREGYLERKTQRVATNIGGAMGVDWQNIRYETRVSYEWGSSDAARGERNSYRLFKREADRYRSRAAHLDPSRRTLRASGEITAAVNQNGTVSFYVPVQARHHLMHEPGNPHNFYDNYQVFWFDAGHVTIATLDLDRIDDESLETFIAGLNDAAQGKLNVHNEFVQNPGAVLVEGLEFVGHFVPFFDVIDQARQGNDQAAAEALLWEVGTLGGLFAAGKALQGVRVLRAASEARRAVRLAKAEGRAVATLDELRDLDEAVEALRLMDEGAEFSETAGRWFQQGRRGALEGPARRAANNPSPQTVAAREAAERQAAQEAQEAAARGGAAGRGAAGAADDLAEFNGRLVNIDDFDYASILRQAVGDAPAGMVEAHAHHILFKKGIGEAQQALVREGQAILRKYGIDPIFGRENLVWAPNVAGQHTLSALQNVVRRLRAIDQLGGTRQDVVNVLERLGRDAARR